MNNSYINVEIVTSLNDQVIETLILDNGCVYPLVIKQGSINKNIGTIGVYSNLFSGFDYISLINCCLKICVLLNKDPNIVYAGICDVNNVKWGRGNRINSAKVIIEVNEL